VIYTIYYYGNPLGKYLDAPTISEIPETSDLPKPNLTLNKIISI